MVVEEVLIRHNEKIGSSRKNGIRYIIPPGQTWNLPPDVDGGHFRRTFQ